MGEARSVDGKAAGGPSRVTHLGDGHGLIHGRLMGCARFTLVFY